MSLPHHRRRRLPSNRIVLVSGAQRQSDALMEKAMGFVARDEKLYDSVLRSSREALELTNGSFVKALSATGIIRGETATRVLLNEGRDVLNEEEVYSAIEPVLTTTNGPFGIFSTPPGKQGRPWEAFQDWLAAHPSDDPLEHRLARYNRRLKRRYLANSRIVVASALNWALRFLRAKDEDGDPLRVPLPPKEVHHHQRIVTPTDWTDIEATLKAKATRTERLCVRLLWETALRPSDLVSIRLEQLALDGNDPKVLLTARKNKAPVASRISQATAALVRRHLEEARPRTFLFESRPGRHYRRQWPWEILRKHGFPRDVTPKTFRRSVATQWPGDLKSLQFQGGWKDAKTILTHYVQERDDAHRKAFDQLHGAEEESDDIAYG